jgi:hypothetical protein
VARRAVRPIPVLVSLQPKPVRESLNWSEHQVSCSTVRRF